MDPNKTQETPQKEGRVRSAWRALRGDPITPVSIRAEWCEVQLRIEAVLDMISRDAARAYERDRAALKKATARIAELESGQTSAPVEVGIVGGGWNPEKVALSRRWMTSRGEPTTPSNGDTP